MVGLGARLIVWVSLVKVGGGGAPRSGSRAVGTVAGCGSGSDDFGRRLKTFIARGSPILVR
jgi:hypothetical protein